MKGNSKISMKMGSKRWRVPGEMVRKGFDRIDCKTKEKILMLHETLGNWNALAQKILQNHLNSISYTGPVRVDRDTHSCPLPLYDASMQVSIRTSIKWEEGFWNLYFEWGKLNTWAYYHLFSRKSELKLLHFLPGIFLPTRFYSPFDHHSNKVHFIKREGSSAEQVLKYRNLLILLKCNETLAFWTLLGLWTGCRSNKTDLLRSTHV